MKSLSSLSLKHYINVVLPIAKGTVYYTVDHNGLAYRLYKDDLVNELLLLAVNLKPKLNDNMNPEAYLKTCFIRKVFKLIKEIVGSNENSYNLELDKKTEEGNSLVSRLESNEDYSDMALSQIYCEDLQVFLKSNLNERDYKLLSLCTNLDKKYKKEEIAKEMNITIPTIYNRLNSIRQLVANNF